tara:strand:- start:260 stop:1015 length:756 start_codon:yes stop_codon:yes gene_type:complete
MNLRRIALILICYITLYSCADYKINKVSQKEERKYYSSSGFALVYEDELYKQKVINKKINNNVIKVMHNQLKINTPIKIINPINSKVVETKVHKNAKYPKIFNIVISNEVAKILELDPDNPYVEVIEVKKNKIFIAKKSNTFEEEKNVAENAPVDEITMDVLSKDGTKIENDAPKKNNFILVINDFYFEDSANKLKAELFEKTKMDNIAIKKINNKKYRLFVGPFKNFNALKTTYISLNNLGFEIPNIYKD